MRPIQAVLAAILAALLVLSAAACGSEPEELAGFVRTPAPLVGNISLPEASAGGAPFNMNATADELLLVYFGYTACPDVCPTTLADIRAALEDLGDDASQIDLAMATIDPGRDTDEIITGYVQAFVSDAHGLRTEDDDVLRTATDAFGADYGVTVADDGDTEVIHTGHVYVVNDEGRILVTWPFGTEVPDMVNDLQILLGAQ